MLRLGLRKRHQNWCHTVEVLVFSFKAPKRSHLSDWFVTRLRFGARFHAKTPLIPLPQPSGLQNDIFSEKLLRCVFTDGHKVVGGLAFISPSTPLQQHGGPKNDTVFQKIFLLYNRSLHPSKNDIGFVNPLKKLPISITTTLPPKWTSVLIFFWAGQRRPILAELTSYYLYSCTATSKAKK